ncbi:MAG TPA: class I SAM-dependent methyltransferase [Actinomycetes bacterium]
MDGPFAPLSPSASRTDPHEPWDVGCGTGALLDLGVLEPRQSTGVDPSQRMLNMFVRNHPDVGRLVPARFEDIEDLAPDYDLATAIEVPRIDVGRLRDLSTDLVILTTGGDVMVLPGIARSWRETRWKTGEDGFVTLVDRLAGTYVGPQAVLEGVFMRLGEIGDDYAVVPEQFVADGDTVVALGHPPRVDHGRRQGRCLPAAR